MNSKKNKKNISSVEAAGDNGLPLSKKSKKNKAEITNENANSENNTRNRKILETETDGLLPKKTKKNTKTPEISEDSPASNDNKKRKNTDIETDIPLKKSKKKTKTQENKDLSATNYNIEIESTAKSSKQKNGHVAKSIQLATDSTDGLEVTKKKKHKLESEEITQNNLDMSISTLKSTKKMKGANQLITVEGIDNAVTDFKNVVPHEVDIIDIKDEKLNEDNENVVTISIRDVEGFDSDWDENDLLKQLERRVEKKEPRKERKAGIEWPDSDLKELVDRMEIGLPENDLKPFMKRADMLEWDKIAFKDYTPEECKKTWSLVLKKIRRYRILKEVLYDAKAWISTPKMKKKGTKPFRHPDMPRRPLSAYFIYYLKKKDSLQAENVGMDATELAKMCSQKFKSLPAEKRAKYEKIANKNKEEYDQKMKEFYEKHPEMKQEKEAKSKKAPKPTKPPKSPKPLVEKPAPKPPKEKVPKRPLSAFQYYHLAEASKDQIEDKVAFKEICKERWKEMPDDKKIEWISYAEAENIKYEEEMKEYIRNHPEYVQSSQNKPQLTREEILVKERLSGKPPKPPVSAYNLFARMLLHSEYIKTVPVKERLICVSNQWKECTEEEKKQYKDLFKKTIEKYNKDFSAYLESLPEEERKLEIQKNNPKRRKSEDEKAKKKPKLKKTPKKKTETNPDKQKSTKTNSTPKKSDKKQRKLVEPEQPPISPFKYFASTYSGEEPVAKAWKALSSEEKKRYEDELVQKKKAYILDFEKFLKSMTKEELENFSNSRKKLSSQNATEDEEEEEEEEETSDQSDSEEDSNDESGNEGD